MYTLTLTHDERRAIDWIGDRYRHGSDLYELLWQPDVKTEPEESDWDDKGSITFTVPEHVAWEIAEIIREGIDCFSDDFSQKLFEFSQAIV